VTPAIYDFHFKQLKCVVPKESLMPFAPFQRVSPGNDFEGGEEGEQGVNGGGMITGQVTAGDVGEYANPMITFIQTAEHEAADPRRALSKPPKSASNCDPLTNDCQSNLEHMLSEAVSSAEADMRPIQNSQVAAKSVLPFRDPTCRADSSILLSDLASRLRARIPSHGPTASTNGIVLSGECDAVMSTAEQEITPHFSPWIASATTGATRV
jgi:hypothetical protein